MARMVCHLCAVGIEASRDPPKAWAGDEAHDVLRRARGGVMLHFWQKPSTVLRGKRATVAVLDNDDEFRLSALRVLRRVDVIGVGLLDTPGALRLLTSTPPTIVIVDVARVEEVRAALAAIPRASRPALIASASHDGLRVDGVIGAVRKPVDEAQLAEVVGRALRMGPRKKSVLLVDDDDDIRESFGILLEEEGYEVVPAPHGKAAWNALEAGLNPDVILLDLMMPVMNGREVYERLRRSTHERTPVVVITAGADAPLPGAPLLRKPIDMRALLKALEQASS